MTDVTHDGDQDGAADRNKTLTALVKARLKRMQYLPDLRRQVPRQHRLGPHTLL